MTSRLELFDVPAAFAPSGGPCALLLPPEMPACAQPPLCIFLHGAGSGREMLEEMRPAFDAWWSSGAIPPLAIVTPSATDMSFYVDDPAGGQWETFTGDLLGPAVRERRSLGDETLISGISMGGFGALAIAFARPGRFAAVAAIEPMLEPALRAADVRPRNRFYYQGGGPEALLGAARDPAFFEAHNPASRARKNAHAIREAGLRIFVEAGDEDALCAHDGAEFLHRVLWDLDIPHEYRLVLGADHVGPSLLPRVRDAFEWMTARRPASGASSRRRGEVEWAEWLDGGGAGPPPATPLHPASELSSLTPVPPPAAE